MLSRDTFKIVKQKLQESKLSKDQTRLRPSREQDSDVDMLSSLFTGGSKHFHILKVSSAPADITLLRWGLMVMCRTRPVGVVIHN